MPHNYAQNRTGSLVRGYLCLGRERHGGWVFVSQGRFLDGRMRGIGILLPLLNIRTSHLSQNGLFDAIRKHHVQDVKILRNLWFHGIAYWIILIIFDDESNTELFVLIRSMIERDNGKDINGEDFSLQLGPSTLFDYLDFPRDIDGIM